MVCLCEDVAHGAGSELAVDSIRAQDHLLFVRQVTGGIHNKVEQATVTEGAEEIVSFIVLTPRIIPGYFVVTLLAHTI